MLINTDKDIIALAWWIYIMQLIRANTDFWKLKNNYMYLLLSNVISQLLHVECQMSQVNYYTSDVIGQLLHA